MNTQEGEQLKQFLQQLTQAQITQKDSEADALIRSACAQQPDASYLLVQRSLLQNQALQNAQQQIAQQQAELAQLRAENGRSRESSFLNDNAWGSSAAQRPGALSGAPNPAPVAYAQAARFAPAAPFATPLNAPNAPSAWGAGMLGSIATTAAGVVAGSFLFQGIEHMLGNHGTHAGAMNGLSGDLQKQNDHRETAPPEHAFNQYPDDSSNNAGVMDTSALDDLIADDTDDYS